MKNPTMWSVQHPVGAGVALGAALPLAVVAPAVLFGQFERLQTGGSVYFLLPILALLAFPAGLAAMLFQRLGGDRKALWRFCTGLLLGGSLAGAVLLGVSFSELSIERRFLFALFGGVLLSGFWIWLGAFLAGFFALEKRSGEAPRIDDPS